MSPAAIEKAVKATAARARAKAARGKVVKPTIEQLKAMHVLLSAIDMPPRMWGRLAK